MFKIELIRDNNRELIHYPAEDAPFIYNADLSESINTVSILEAVLPLHLKNSISAYKTFIQVSNATTNSNLFTGRIISQVENMDGSGAFSLKIVAEELLGLLNDGNTRNYIKKAKPKTILSDILNYYNKKQGNKYTFKAGIVEDYEDDVSVEFPYESCLSSVLNLVDITVREVKTRLEGNVVFVDLVKKIGKDKRIPLQLGVNMMEITKEIDISDFANRIVPIAQSEAGGILTIKGLKNDNDYVEDNSSIEEYGVIEKIVQEHGNIKDKNTLYKWGTARLNEYKVIKLIMECSAVDLSYIAGSEVETMNLGDTIHIINPPLNLNIIVRVLEKTTNLFEPYNPKLVISSRRITGTDYIIDTRNKQRIQSKLSILQSHSVDFEDNIAKDAPIIKTITTNSESTSSFINLTTEQYRYFTESGVSLGSYPNKIKIYNNNTLIHTLEAKNESVEFSNLEFNAVKGKNTIKITSENNGRLRGSVEVVARS